jgi:DNA recombination protein RmuC
MSNLFLIIVIVFVVAAGVVASVYLIKRELKRKKEEELPWSFLKQDIEALKKSFGDGFTQMAQELGRVQEIGHTLRDFQDFLKSPKLRGGVGEQVLRDLLEQVLPKNNFQIQYQFREGQMVDAIIKTKQGLIPIDSKFPMESFQKYIKSTAEKKEDYLKEFIRDIKKHIDDISRKYILPQEGTLDYAIMYVPVESVFSEITLNEPELLEYAHQKKVILVSPNTFYYFLKIIMIGLEGARIEEASRKILEGLKAIQQESIKFGEELTVMTSHIDNAKKASERVTNRYIRLSGKIDNLGLIELEEKPKEIEEPEQ